MIISLLSHIFIHVIHFNEAATHYCYLLDGSSITPEVIVVNAFNHLCHWIIYFMLRNFCVKKLLTRSLTHSLECYLLYYTSAFFSTAFLIDLWPPPSRRVNLSPLNAAGVTSYSTSFGAGFSDWVGCREMQWHRGRCLDRDGLVRRFKIRGKKNEEFLAWAPLDHSSVHCTLQCSPAFSQPVFTHPCFIFRTAITDYCWTANFSCLSVFSLFLFIHFHLITSAKKLRR